MKILGTIRNSKNQDPVKGANIRFSIEGTEITSVISNEHGKYEYIAEEDHTGQTLDFAIQKDGFEIKNISNKIDKDEIKVDILLNEVETKKKEIDETIEKTRISGTIRNPINRDPVQEAIIKISIEGTQIATITSSEMGEYEYIAEQDYTGQTLDITIKKDNYIEKNISYEIDGSAIKSDILLDEIKIEIKGKICDEKDSPLDNANISFSIGNSRINLNSDKYGSFSFTIGQQFLNQTIGYEVSREGFKTNNGKLTLIEDLKHINLIRNIPVDNGSSNKKWIAVAAIGISLAVIAIFLLWDGSSDLSTDPDKIDFDFVPGTGVQTFLILNNGKETLKWVVYSDRDWIKVFPESGIDSATVSVSVNSDGMDPGKYTGRITVESDGSTKIGKISLIIPEDNEPTDEPAEPTDGSPEPTDEPAEPTDEPTIPTKKPRIHYFKADPESIDSQGGFTTLSWEISDATSVIIDEIGKVDESMGSIQRVVSKTTTFTIEATNDAGTSDDEVTVTIDEQLPELSVTPDPPDLDFGTMDKGDTDSRTFSISNTGSGTLEGEISTHQDWININPTTWTNSKEITVTVKTEDLDAGSHGGTITVESNGGNMNIPVSLVIKSSIPATPTE
ncbi:MAG: hypothetical protein C5S41_13810 [Candidatus Methanomarinus sp.]|nr:MAG: hypothetical protein C5S41_13810 [ANME-2 cluster archaeon]